MNLSKYNKLAQEKLDAVIYEQSNQKNIYGTQSSGLLRPQAVRIGTDGYGYQGYNQVSKQGPTGSIGATGPIGVQGKWTVNYPKINRELILKEAMLIFDISEEDIEKNSSIVLSKIRDYKITKITE